MALPNWSSEYIGLEFKSNGRDRYGLDCWGLVRLVLMEQFRIKCPSLNQSYQDTKDMESIPLVVDDTKEMFIPIKLGDEMAGDVIILRVRGIPMHVGIVLGGNKMLHIEENINSSIEDYSGKRWRDRVIGFYRHKEI